MAKADSTASNKAAPGGIVISFPASITPIYQLRGNATNAMIQDHLDARLSQLEAMLTMSHGNGFATFDSWSDEIKDNYLWGCAMLATECKELASIINVSSGEVSHA